MGFGANRLQDMYDPMSSSASPMRASAANAALSSAAFGLPGSDTPEIQKYKKRFNTDILCAALWGTFKSWMFVGSIHCIYYITAKFALTLSSVKELVSARPIMSWTNPAIQSKVEPKYMIKSFSDSVESRCTLQSVIIWIVGMFQAKGPVTECCLCKLVLGATSLVVLVAHS